MAKHTKMIDETGDFEGDDDDVYYEGSDKVGLAV